MGREIKRLKFNGSEAKKMKEKAVEETGISGRCHSQASVFFRSPSFQIGFQLLVPPETQGSSAGRSLKGLAATCRAVPFESVMLSALGNGNFWWMTWYRPQLGLPHF